MTTTRALKENKEAVTSERVSQQLSEEVEKEETRNWKKIIIRIIDVDGLKLIANLDWIGEQISTLISEMISWNVNQLMLMVRGFSINLKEKILEYLRMEMILKVRMIMKNIMILCKQITIE
jgi:hypothetical protein